MQALRHQDYVDNILRSGGAIIGLSLHDLTYYEF